MIAASLGQLMVQFVEHVIITDSMDRSLWAGGKLADVFPVQIGDNAFDALSVPAKKQIQSEIKLSASHGKEYLLQTHLFASDSLHLKILTIKHLTDTNEELSEKLHCYEEIFQTINEGIVFSDSEGKIVLYNRAQEKLEGLKQEEMVGKYLWDAYKYYDPRLSEHQHVMESRKSITNKYGVHSCIDNITKPVKYSTFPIIRRNRAVGVFSISTNDFLLKDLLNETIEVKRNLLAGDAANQKKSSSNGTAYTFDFIKGKSKEIKKAIREAQNIATYDTDVLIVGETGTGKELFAQSIHNYSKRAGSPFVAINCAAIPETLLESTLFGTVKGAYTGATNQAGLFEHAEDGTLFLDEINSMPLTLQSKLIRVLEEREVRRLGTNTVTPIRCRVISASNQDPKHLIEKQQLRLDLYYRLARTYLYLPPLRDRPVDIEFDEEKLDITHLPATLMESIENSSLLENEKPAQTRPIKSALNPAKKRMIIQALESVDWNITSASKILGTTRQNLQYHIRKLNIKPVKA